MRRISAEHLTEAANKLLPEPLEVPRRYKSVRVVMIVELSDEGARVVKYAEATGKEQGVANGDLLALFDSFRGGKVR